MYVLTVEERFASAHQLRGYRGKCENLHGHNWRVVLSVQGTELDGIGLLIDFGELKAILRDIVSDLDHCNLNEHRYFSIHNPSSENIARFIAEECSSRLQAAHSGKITLDSVTVWESETSRCTYRFI